MRNLIQNRLLMNKVGYVYIMANTRPTLYVGVTNNLKRRVFEHKESIDTKSFTSKYRLHKLVYFEFYHSISEAIIREKQIKDLSRTEKLASIRLKNPNLEDLVNELINL